MWNSTLSQIVMIEAIICWTNAPITRIMPEEQSRDISLSPFIGAASDRGMDRFWQSEPEWLILWLAALAVLITVAWYVIGKIHPKSIQKERWANESLSKFRELHSKGELSNEEFRTIKTNLEAQIQNELSDNDEKD